MGDKNPSFPADQERTKKDQVPDHEDYDGD